MPSFSSGTITLGGLGSGIDTGALLDAILRARRRPIDLLEGRRSGLQQVRSRLSQFRGLVEKLQEAAEELSSRRDFLAFSASSTNESIVRATATGEASSGTFSVEVMALAKAEIEKSQGYADADTTTVGTGDLILTVGGTAHTISIGTGSDTLEGVRDAINDAEIGVTATVVNTGAATDPFVLVLRGNETGVANSFQVDVTGLSGGTQSLVFTETQAAQDARIKVDTIEIFRSSNVIADVVEGVELSLQSVSAPGVTETITLSPDTAEIRSRVEAFVEAHNALIQFINAELKPVVTGNPNALSGEISLRSIQQRVLSALGAGGYPGGVFSTLGEVGLRVQSDGTLSLDSARFDAAIQDDLEGFAAFFTTVGDRVSGTGFSLLEVPGAVADGTYDVAVTQAATKASVSAGQAFAAGGLSADETLTITQGATTVEVTLLAGDDLATAVSRINDALDDAGSKIAASDQAGVLKLAADEYGSAGSFSVVSDRPGNDPTFSGIGTTPLSGTGLDVAGTIGGFAATGEGQVLTGADGTPVEGVEIKYSGASAGTGTLTVGADGFFTRIDDVLEGALDKVDGLLEARLDGIDESIRKIGDRIEDMEERLSKFEARLFAQFSALEDLMARLQSQTSFLSIFLSRGGAR
jgi:flagellar hook-associated protein 2